jgi:hypothetical protein
VVTSRFSQRLSIALVCLVVFLTLPSSPLLATNDPPGLDVASLDYETRISTEVAPLARSLPEFAGIYMDRATDGRAVVMLTRANPHAEDAMRALVGDAAQGIEFTYVTHSYAELQKAIDLLWEQWPNRFDGRLPVAIGLNTIGNSLDLYVEQDQVDATSAAKDALSKLVGIPISVIVSPPVTSRACTDRDHCTSPMKAGNRIHKGSNYGSLCTMGFHVVHGTAKQFLTAGHCILTGSPNWYHQGYGFVGPWAAHAVGNGGFDSALIDMPAAQVSNKIYGTSWPVGGWVWATVGHTVYKSAGAQNGVFPSFIHSDYVTYILPECNCMLYGATMELTPGTAGDSGSPIYEVHSNSKAYAVGTDLGTLGQYSVLSRIGDAVNRWGLSMVTS